MSSCFKCLNHYSERESGLGTFENGQYKCHECDSKAVAYFQKQIPEQEFNVLVRNNLNSLKNHSFKSINNKDELPK